MSVRVVFVAGFSSLVLTSAAFAGNTAVIGQTGVYNGAYTQQYSQGRNTSLTFQNGYSNNALTAQTGRNNGAGISQSGYRNKAGVLQSNPASSMP